MSSNSTIRSLVLLTVFVLSIGLIGSEAGALGLANGNPGDSGQNANSSTTTDSTTNTTATKKSRGKKRKANANTATSANDNSSMTGADQTNTNAAATDSSTAQDTTAAQSTGTSSAKAAGQSHDLSGTYSGVVNYPDGGLTGPATLTISGSDFTLTPEGGSPVTGRVSAVKTAGYTGVAMQMGQVAPSTAGQPAAPHPATISLRMRRSGDSLSLTSVPGSPQQFSFTPASTARKGSKRAKTPATPTTTAPGEESTTPTGEATAAPATSTPKKRGTRRGSKNTNTSTNTNNSNSEDTTNSNNANNP